MMFDEVVKLFDNYKKYIKSRKYELEHARTSLNQFFDHKLKNFSSEITQKSHEELKEQFDKINVN
jgi:hypothetical protein